MTYQWVKLIIYPKRDLKIFKSTRKCPLRGHCLTPPGRPRAGKTQEVIPKFIECKFFTLNTYQETFIIDILRYVLKLYSVTDGLTN